MKHSKDKSHLFSFLAHLRNAIAHGNFEKENNFIVLTDYKDDRGNEVTMKARINYTKFYNLIRLLSYEEDTEQIQS